MAHDESVPDWDFVRDRRAAPKVCPHSSLPLPIFLIRVLRPPLEPIQVPIEAELFQGARAPRTVVLDPNGSRPCRRQGEPGRTMGAERTIAWQRILFESSCAGSRAVLPTMTCTAKWKLPDSGAGSNLRTAALSCPPPSISPRKTRAFKMRFATGLTMLRIQLGKITKRLWLKSMAIIFAAMSYKVGVSRIDRPWP